MTSLQQPSAEKQKWYRTSVFRTIVSTTGSIFCTGLVVAAAYFSAQQQLLASAILFSLIPTVVFAFVFVIVQRFDDNAAKYKQEIERLAENNNRVIPELHKLSTEINKTVQGVGDTLNLYGPFRQLLNNHVAQSRMIRRFLRLSMGGSLVIWQVKESDIYNLIMDGARQCSYLDAIHHGSISDLGRSQYSSTYLKDLQDIQCVRRRIIILKPGEVAELQDRAIVEKFLKETEGTTSYWIDEDEFFRISKIINRNAKLDCGLHDKKVLLQFHHDGYPDITVAILSFDGEHEEIYDGVIRAFEALDLELERQKRQNVHHIKFHKID